MRRAFSTLLARITRVLCQHRQRCGILNNPACVITSRIREKIIFFNGLHHNLARLLPQRKIRSIFAPFHAAPRRRPLRGVAETPASPAPRADRAATHGARRREGKSRQFLPNGLFGEVSIHIGGSRPIDMKHIFVILKAGADVQGTSTLRSGNRPQQYNLLHKSQPGERSCRTASIPSAS
jgi:hypothetical protein